MKSLVKTITTIVICLLILIGKTQSVGATPEQGWTWDESHWWHHASQGTMFMPYQWFLALERFDSDQLLSSKQFLIDEVGFLPSPQTEYNPDGLPVGFSKARRKFGPGQGQEWVGLTCAACHTGQIDYKGSTIEIQGGPARANFKTFRTNILLAILGNRCDIDRYQTVATAIRQGTLAKLEPKLRAAVEVHFASAQDQIGKAFGQSCSPSKFQRFASRVTGSTHPVTIGAFAAHYDEFVDKAIHAGLQRQFVEIIAQFGPCFDSPDNSKKRYRGHEKLCSDPALNPSITPPGPGRIDALMRGGNRLFSILFKEPMNAYPETGPVSLPPLWDTPHLETILYNGSGLHPLSRSIVEALGVGAHLYLSSDPNNQFADFQHVAEAVNAAKTARANNQPTQGHLRGLDRMTGQSEAILPALDQIQTSLEYLRSPVWPERVLGPIDRGEKWRAGRDLYERHCVQCHALIDRAGPFPDRIPVALNDIEQVGTDHNMASNFADRRISSELNKIERFSVPQMVEVVTDLVIERFVESENVSKAELSKMTRGLPNEWIAEKRYRARPLNGIWASAPYLHNGSVPNLYELLTPGEARRSFCQGEWEFDAMNVGLHSATDCAPRHPPQACQTPEGQRNPECQNLFRTDINGNSNRGHDSTLYLPEEIRNSDEKRYQLIEFLKSL